MASSPPPQSRTLAPWAQKSLTWMSRLGRPSVVSTLTTAAIVLSLRALGALQGLELNAYDQLMRLRPALPPDERLLVVGIDETDVQSRQEWPIQDQTLADLIDVLLAAEPRAIGLDIFRDVPIGEGREALLTQIEESDRLYPVCRLSSPNLIGISPPPGTPELRVSFADLPVDSGGTLRRALLVAAPPADASETPTHLCNDPNAQLFSLGLQLALHYLEFEDIALGLTQGLELQLDDTVLTRLEANTGGYHNLHSSGYQIMLNYRAAADAIPQVSLTEVLSGQVSPDLIRDRIVLIGATTPEAKDAFYTPFSGGLEDDQKMPGVIVHAQATSQILSAVLNNRPLLWSWPSSGEALWIVTWGLVGAVFASFVHRPLVFALGAGVLLVSLFGICYLIFIQGGWIPLVPPALALVLAAGGVVLLDRFSKSDYGQAVYKQMKSLLRLEIEIDKGKVGQQVAEITDTDYFGRLQQQARELRAQRQNQSSQSVVGPANPPRSPRSGPTALPTEHNHPTTDVDDYVDNLKRKAQRIKSPKSDSDKTNPS